LYNGITLAITIIKKEVMLSAMVNELTNNR